MNKNRTGTCVLVYLVAMQVGSTPQLVDSEQMLRCATLALLAYIAFAIILLWFAARSARALNCRPRLCTLANLATCVLLAIATWTAWQTHCLRVEVAIAAAALVAALAYLHWCNIRKRKTSSKTQFTDVKVVRPEMSPRCRDL